MRKFLMITVLAGAGALGLGVPAPAEAAPHGFAIPAATTAAQAPEGVQAQVEQVQYRRYHRRPHYRRYHRRGRY